MTTTPDPAAPPAPAAPAECATPAAPDPDSLIELEIGPVAHGGHCVARHEGRVVFVRHTLPGERVLARLTESGATATFWRADAVQILHAAPGRVAPPCPLSGPDACGGCDWQHVTPPVQRELKAAVLTEQLQRLAGLTPGEDGVPPVVVEPVAGEHPDGSGLGWRTRMRFTVDGSGRAGLRKHRSHEVVPVPRCPISTPEVQAAGAGAVHWPIRGSIDVIAPGGHDNARDAAEPRDDAQPRDHAQPWDDAQRLVVAEADEQQGKWRMPALPGATSVAVRQPAGDLTRLSGRTWVRETVTTAGLQRPFRVTGTGFWQVHAGAPQTLLDAVMTAARPKPGERIADLYSGAGLFAAGLALATGPDGLVVAVESDTRAVKDARRSLHDLPQVRFSTGDVAVVLPQLSAEGGPLASGADIVVLDPPRTGAGRTVISQIAALDPRVIVYVACDPAALARDVAFAAAHGYRLTGLRAFDLFPMTHHLECVATLTQTT